MAESSKELTGGGQKEVEQAKAVRCGNGSKKPKMEEEGPP